jgi:GntR family transcriptional regulator/MocR family aminotransferase
MADHIVYLGTTSKIINPDLRLTWAIVPAFVADELRRRHTADIDTVGALSIAFVAEFLASGALARHLASASRTYAARRNRFTDACHRQLPDVDVMGIDAGLHVVLSLDHAEADDVALVHVLRRRGLACAALSTAYEDSTRRRSGLICGYALLPETKCAAAAALIAEAAQVLST